MNNRTKDNNITSIRIWPDMPDIINGSSPTFLQWHAMALQTGESQVRFPMVSLEFFIEIVFLAALRPWGRLSF